METRADFIAANRLKVAFESDYVPQELARFIERLNPFLFGINYDIGNSAAMGFDPQKEFGAYGHRVINVHVKDRLLGGSTVPLSTGSANFDVVFAALAQINYKGNFILQTARATDGKHADAICTYRDMTVDWLKRYAT
jgi:hexulose-6-phosphate isomerase